MKRKTALIVTVGILVVVLAFFAYQSTQDGAKAYEKTLITYLDAMKEGTETAIKYAGFPNETVEYDYLHSPMRIVDYEIVSANQVNDNLYAFTLNIAGSDQPEVYTPLYYFVGHQNGEYIVYINAGYVPEALRENFDADDYSYSNPDYLDGVPEIDE